MRKILSLIIIDIFAAIIKLTIGGLFTSSCKETSKKSPQKTEIVAKETKPAEVDKPAEIPVEVKAGRNYDYYDDLLNSPEGMNENFKKEWGILYKNKTKEEKEEEIRKRQELGAKFEKEIEQKELEKQQKQTVEYQTIEKQKQIIEEQKKIIEKESENEKRKIELARIKKEQQQTIEKQQRIIEEQRKKIENQKKGLK